MATQEFYVRGINDTEARGPFTVEQLVTLGETGQIDTETLYYEAATEQWATFASNEELKNSVFPPRKRLTVKPKEKISSLNVAREEHRPITVEEMLADAEGRTAETKDKRNLIVVQDRSAKIGLYAGLVVFLLSSAALLLPHADVIVAMNYEKILTQPLLILGLIDLTCAVLLGLGMATIYPFVRFRAALGVGFLGLFYWLQDRPEIALAVAVGSVGMYFCTVFLRYAPVIASALLGVVGMGGFAFLLLR